MTSKVSSNYNVCLYFLAIILPPLSVLLRSPFSQTEPVLYQSEVVQLHVYPIFPDFWINICLSILGWIPGIIHAWCNVIAKTFAWKRSNHGPAGLNPDSEDPKNRRLDTNDNLLYV
ncbi:hypothetical protein GG344DRAFT_63987 [Lentinula edodes]|nr:hypothetical protein GG344DRAFT_63987 [Lentinula edodes]